MAPPTPSPVPAASSALVSSMAFRLGTIGLNAATGIGFPCPWRVLTGTLCPFCGSTHLGVALLHGEFVLATLTRDRGEWWLKPSLGAPVQVEGDVEIWAMIKALVRTTV